jgi:hypothetical protein
MARATRTKSEREYVKTIIHSLSLQRLTDYEIVEYLHKIKIARPTVTAIRNNLERSAEKWYIDLRQSRYKYVATYKERIDALLSYQRKLNQILSFYFNPPFRVIYTDTVIRAIAELHRIEISLFNLCKQLRALDIVDNTVKNALQQQQEPSLDDVYGREIAPWNNPPWLQCNVCSHWWKNQELLDTHKIRESGLDKLPPDIEANERHNWYQCDICKRWWEGEKLLDAHKVR